MRATLVLRLASVGTFLPTGAAGWADGQGARLSLAEAERIALRNSTELRVARLQVGSAREATHERLRAFFPSVSLSYRQNQTVARRDFDNGQYSVQLNVSQPIYDGGRSGLAYAAAKIEQALAGSRLRRAAEELRFKVREAYLAVLEKRARLSVARHSLKSARFFFRTAVLEHRQGNLTSLDLRERANELEQRRLAESRTADALADSVAALAQLLELPRGELLQPRALDLFRLRTSAVGPKESDLLARALQTHPQVRELRLDLARRRREYLIAKHDYLPSVALTGRYGRTGDEWPPRTIEWGLGVSVTFSLFGSTLSNDVTGNRTVGDPSRSLSAGGSLNLYDNPGWRRSRLDATTALLRSKAGLKALERSVRHDLHRLLRDVHRLRSDMRLADEDLAIRELRHRIDLRRVQLGDLKYREFIEEEHRLIESRNALATKRTQFILAVNRMELQLGQPLDSTELINWKDLEPRGGATDSIRRSWKPRTQIRRPRPIGPQPQNTPGDRGVPGVDAGVKILPEADV